VKALRFFVGGVDDAEFWPSVWEHCTTTVSSDFERLGRMLQLPWSSGGASLEAGVSLYAEFDRPGRARGSYVPAGERIEDVIGRLAADAEYVPSVATIKVTIEREDSQLRYDGVLESGGSVVRHGPSGLVGCPRHPAKLMRMLEKVLGEIGRFVSDCERPIRDLAS